MRRSAGPALGAGDEFEALSGPGTGAHGSTKSPVDRAGKNPGPTGTCAALFPAKARRADGESRARHALGLGCLLALAWPAVQAGTAPNAALNARFEAEAKQAPRGDYPKYWLGEQSYFTVAGAYRGGPKALLNEEGAVEVGRESWRVEPFLYAGNHLATWGEAAPAQSLEQGYLPMPAVRWHWNGLNLTVTAWGVEQGGAALRFRYRVENAGPQRMVAKLFLAIRPFQVNPPWQSLNITGGAVPIHALEFGPDGVRADGALALRTLNPPAHVGALDTGATSLVSYLRQHGAAPAADHAHSAEGLAAGALEYPLDLAPGAAQDIYLEVPGQTPSPVNSPAEAERSFGDTAAFWEGQLNRAEWSLPPEAAKLADILRSNLAYILINREGPALHPGTRTYARSWIRDGAVMVSALLGTGHAEEARRFIEWYAGFQYPDGKLPCCVDRRGADPTPEHDSAGEFIYAVAEYARYTHDAGFVRALWPKVREAARYLESLRAQRLTDAYLQPERRAFYGLLPESISHEGYAAHPVHAYWDDFWALRGLKDAAELAGVVKDTAEAAHLARLRDDFRRDVLDSLRRVMAERKLAYLPASADLGDFDSNAVAMIVNQAGEQGNLPQDALRASFDEYWAYFQKRRDGKLDWEAYTPYEVRSVEALVRLGRRAEALELLGFLLAAQRPPGWNHWAEIVWRDPKAPKFIGDMPHAWIGAEFVRAARALFAYESEEDHALVLAAGLPEAWLEGGAEVGVQRLPTWYGTLSYGLKRTGPDELRVKLSGDLALPPGKIVLKAPAGRPLRAVRVNGKPSQDFTADAAVIGEFPAEVVLSYAAASRAESR